MLALQSCLTVMAVLGAVPLLMALPTDQTWFVHHSGQVARPVMINSSPVSDEFPIPRFSLPGPAASRRQDGPFQASGSNNLQNEPPVHVKPGDKVSLIVRNQNPLDPQKFVDVGALLMDLQRMPPSSDGSYHVFLAPPNYPQPSGGQKFDVTYVGAPQREQQPDPRNPHPPLFVAPLDYSVPQGYGRVQIPIQNVKFALHSQLQQVQQQPQQFQQQTQPAPFQQAQPQFRQPQPQFQQVQFQPPQPAQFQQPQPVQFQPPQPVQFQPPQSQPAQFQSNQPQPVQAQFTTPQAQPVQFHPTEPQPVQFLAPQPAQFLAPQPAQFQPPQPTQFQAPQPQPAQFQAPQPQPPQFQAPQPQPAQVQAPQPVQFQAPQPQQVRFQPQFQPPQPQFQPIPSQQPQFQPQFQKQTFVSDAQRPQFQQPPPSSFEQSLSDVRLQTGFVPFQTLDEPATSPPPPPPSPPTQPASKPAPREPLVLAVESPEFLELIKPRPVPQVVEVIDDVPVSEAPRTTTIQPAVPVEEIVEPVVELKPVAVDIVPAAFQSEVPVAVTLAPPPAEDSPVPAPTPAFEQTIPAAIPIPAPQVSEPTESPTVRPLKKRPINRVPLEGGAPRWPDFQSVRQRQQLQRQQNRKKVPASTAINFESGDEQPEVPIEASFGQKIRNKVKTNSLVSPPLPVQPQIVVEQPKIESFVVEEPVLEQSQSSSFDLDPPVDDREESFQTLESQNAASGNQRGRIRFNRPNINVIPSEVSSEPSVPVRQTVSTLVGGRGRIRLNSASFTTSTPTTAGTTASPTEAATPARTVAPTTIPTTAAPTAPPTTASPVVATTVPTVPPAVTPAATTTAPPTVASTAAHFVDSVATEEPAGEEEILRGDSPSVLVEEEDVPAIEDEDLALEEEEEEQPVAVEDAKSVEPAEKPWSPYEAIQRQRETTVEPEVTSQLLTNNGQPLRVRGKTTFSSSRIPLPPVRPEAPNRQVVLRPAAVIRRPLPPSVRITKPIFGIQEEQSVRTQEDFIPPQSLEFGIRDGIDHKPILINNPPVQLQLPIGRRVPENRPSLQNIRINRPTTEAPTTTTAAPIIEEEPADVLQEETDELVTDDPILTNDQFVEEEAVEGHIEGAEEEEEEEEILTDEVEGEENEEFVEPETVDEVEPISSSTSAPTTGPTMTIAEAFSEIPEEEHDVADVEEDVVEEQIKPVATEPTVTTTTEAAVVVEPETAVEEEESVVELAAGNQVDDQSDQKELADDDRQVLGVSTATEVSLMYELCYRGRCVRVHE
ncbi:cell surface glycoprotein 1-like [Daphnia carinata]|uniref:cell surface glycoprotein 1-like n=1 Tax=Daphnia carinata TaxID=120202 RepID=UPI00257F9856|nr:cell surface glycoprotein 1-like [Daphnia carinata]